MSIPDTLQREISPTHPVAMLREDFLPECGLSASTLANALAVSRQTVSELLRERRSLIPHSGVRMKTVMRLVVSFRIRLVKCKRVIS